MSDVERHDPIRCGCKDWDKTKLTHHLVCETHGEHWPCTDGDE